MRISIFIIITTLLLACSETKKETDYSGDSDTTFVANSSDRQHATSDPDTPVSSDTQPIKSAQPDEDAPIGKYSGTCYLQTSGRDSVRLHIIINGNNISGQMQYDNYQIDGSSGEVNGTVSGDIIKLWYNGFSEGQHFRRQVWFKKSDDRLLWGKGSQVTRNDSSFFSNPEKITYSSVLFLREMPCDEVVVRMK